MPALPVALIGRVRALVVPQAWRSSSQVSSMMREELGVEVPEQRAAQGVGRLGVRVGRAGAEEVPLVDHGPTLPPPIRTRRRG